MKKYMLGLILLVMFSILATATYAQSITTFTYQGRLSDNGNPANGIYDLSFGLYDSETGVNSVSEILTNFATGVNKAIFIAALDFGGSVFNGNARWLEICVRTNGIGSFTTLSPRQQLTPTPYAITANSAISAAMATTVSGTIPVTQLTGSISDARLSANVALLTGSPNFSGTVTATAFKVSNGSGTNLPSSGGLTWQVASGTAIQAQPNTGYLLTNDAQVTLTLPPSLNIGDTVQISSIGFGGWKMVLNPLQSVVLQYLSSDPSPPWRNLPVWRGESLSSWRSVASSSDGTKLVVVAFDGQIYTSTDSGANWTARGNSGRWESVVSSSDGAKLLAAGDGRLFVSIDSGSTWIRRGGDRSWGSWLGAISSSADGIKLVAIDADFYINTSTDSGVTWTLQASDKRFSSVASASDGTKLVAVEYSISQIYTSTNSGATWTARDAIGESVASSSDGTKLVAIFEGRQIYTSTDSGATWTARDSESRWKSVASAADGTKLVAVVSDGLIYTSTNSGASWTARESSRRWSSVSSSSDGTKLVAVVSDGLIYNSTDSGVTWRSTSPFGSFTGRQYSV